MPEQFLQAIRGPAVCDGVHLFGFSPWRGTYWSLSGTSFAFSSDLAGSLLSSPELVPFFKRSHFLYTRMLIRSFE